MTTSEASSLLWDQSRLHGRGESTLAKLRLALQDALRAGHSAADVERWAVAGWEWGRSEVEDVAT